MAFSASVNGYVHANTLRGEATIAIAGCTYTLAATMESIATVADMLGDPPIHEFYRRLVGVSLFTARAALAALTQRGTDPAGKEMTKEAAAKRAVAEFALSDCDAMQEALVKLVAALTRKSEGPAEEEDAGNRPAAQA